MNALAFAEQPAREETREGIREEKHEPLTDEERQAKFKRYRDRAVESARVKIDDDTVMAFVAFQSIEELYDAQAEKIGKIEARDDLTDEEKDQRIEAVRTTYR